MLDVAKVPSRYRGDIQLYLERAKTKYTNGVSWTTQWRNLHGGGRTSSTYIVGFFRIKVKKTSANPPAYRTIIVCSKGDQYFRDTELEFPDEPDANHIIDEYKRMFDIEATAPVDTDNASVAQ